MLCNKETRLSFSERAKQATHPLSKRLFSIMESKKSNLALALDVVHAKDLLTIAEQLAPYLCVIKTHIDLLEDFTPEISQKLRAIADHYECLIFEDRKFADIGNTVKHQYEGGLYRISEWAHLTNAHSLLGPGVVDGLQQAGIPKGNALLLLAQLSAQENLIDHNYTEKTIQLAYRYPEFVIGFICQQKLSTQPGLLHLTPGVQESNRTDSLKQSYVTPKEAIIEKQSDIIIVGRGILNQTDRIAAAKYYQREGWNAHQNLIV